LLTKVLTGEKRWNICWHIMWWTEKAKVQLPVTGVHEVYLPSWRGQWLYKIGFICLPLKERMFIYELGIWQSPSRGDRMNPDVVDHDVTP
jgi:hypothetical protein